MTYTEIDQTTESRYIISEFSQHSYTNLSETILVTGTPVNRLSCQACAPLSTAMRLPKIELNSCRTNLKRSRNQIGTETGCTATELPPLYKTIDPETLENV